MPLPSLKERGRMTAFVQHTGRQTSQSPQKYRRGAQSPDTIFTDNPEGINVVRVKSEDAKEQDNVFDENTRPPSVQSSVDRRAARLDQMFDGSELSEGFMQSGRSTPTSEYDDRVPVKFVPNAGRGQQRLRRPPHPSHDIRNDVPKLAFEDDLRMTFVAPPRQVHAGDMKDGFSAATVAQNTRLPPSPMRKPRDQYKASGYQAKLPLREQQPTAPRHTDDGRGRTETRGRYNVPSPQFDDSDDGSSSAAAREDLETTPKSKPQPARNRPQYPTSPVKPANERKRPRPALDYDDEALSRMDYKELDGQPFDFNPATSMASGNMPGQASDFQQRLAQMRHVGSSEQQRLFGSMSVEEWEAAGGWFSEQFAGIMKRLVEARQSKRRVVETFEQEAAAREADVRRRSDKIDEKLQKMREDGLKVVGGRVA